MKYNLDKRRLSYAKPLPQIRSPTPRSSRPLTFTRTKKLSYSLLQPIQPIQPTQPLLYPSTPHPHPHPHRYYTQAPSSQLLQDKYITNLTQIKKLKQQLKRITERRKKIANPEYLVNVEQDVGMWSKSIKVVKGQLQGLRNDGRVRVKKVDSYEKREREVYKGIQEEMKERNRLGERVQESEREIEYSREKNEELERQIEHKENQESTMAYLKKLKQIQIIQHSTYVQSDKLSSRYQLLEEQFKKLDLKSYQTDTELAECENQLIKSMTNLNELTVLLYSRSSQDSNQITEQEEEDQDYNEFV